MERMSGTIIYSPTVPDNEASGFLLCEVKGFLNTSFFYLRQTVAQAKIRHLSPGVVLHSHSSTPIPQQTSTLDNRQKLKLVNFLCKYMWSGFTDWNLLNSSCRANFSSLSLIPALSQFHKMTHGHFDETPTKVLLQLRCIQANDLSERITIR